MLLGCDYKFNGGSYENYNADFTGGIQTKAGSPPMMSIMSDHKYSGHIDKEINSSRFERALRDDIASLKEGHMGRSQPFQNFSALQNGAAVDLKVDTSRHLSHDMHLGNGGGASTVYSRSDDTVTPKQLWIPDQTMYRHPLSGGQQESTPRLYSPSGVVSRQSTSEQLTNQPMQFPQQSMGQMPYLNKPENGIMHTQHMDAFPPRNDSRDRNSPQMLYHPSSIAAADVPKQFTNQDLDAALRLHLTQQAAIAQSRAKTSPPRAVQLPTTAHMYPQQGVAFDQMNHGMPPAQHVLPPQYTQHLHARTPAQVAGGEYAQFGHFGGGAAVGPVAGGMMLPNYQQQPQVQPLSVHLSGFQAQASAQGRQYTQVNSSAFCSNTDVMGEVVYLVQLKTLSRYHMLDSRAAQQMLQSSQGGVIRVGEFVIIDADRGEDLGVVTGALSMMEFMLAKQQNARGAALDHDDSAVGRILRVASKYERQQLPGKFHDEQIVVESARQIAFGYYGNGATIIDAEYQFDRNKLTVYYDSTSRIDFRELVRDLFATYKTRIWLKKYNVRHFYPKQFAIMALSTGVSFQG